MAKQNFIAGGYVGKLGETVGQRWKNKRTVRVYVIPHNPRTPNQQKWRGRFREAVPYAQIGMTFNTKAPCWENASLTEWQQRMSVAKTNVDNGVSGWQCIPLFPKGYTPKEQATSATMKDLGGNIYTIIPRGAGTVETGRVFTVLLHCENTETGEKEDLTAEGIAGRTEEGGIDVEIPGHVLAFGDMVMAVTCDDAEHENEMYYIPPMELVADTTIVVDSWIASTYSQNGRLRLWSGDLVNVGAETTFQFYGKMRNILTGELVERRQVLSITATSGAVDWGQQYPWYGFYNGTSFGAEGRHLTLGGKDYVFPTVATEFLQRENYPIYMLIPDATVLYEVHVYRETGSMYVEATWSIPKEEDITELLGAEDNTEKITVSMPVSGSQHVEDFAIEEFGYEEGTYRKYFSWKTEERSVVPDAGQMVTVTADPLSIKTRYITVGSKIQSTVDVVEDE